MDDPARSTTIYDQPTGDAGCHKPAGATSKGLHLKNPPPADS